MGRVAVVIPALQAEATVANVVRSLLDQWPKDHAPNPVFVIDDGSTDNTATAAREAGATVVSHPRNLGKGSALRTGLARALQAGFSTVVSMDADGQHPAEEAIRLAFHPADPHALLLGVRDLEAAAAPRANQMSNRISNFFLSVFSGHRLADTQCGLRRYPVRDVLGLDPRAAGFGFEAEVILLAAKAGIPLVQVPVRVIYDMPDRTTHFRVVRDPTRIVCRVLFTVARPRPAYHPCGSAPQ